MGVYEQHLQTYHQKMFAQCALSDVNFEWLVAHQRAHNTYVSWMAGARELIEGGVHEDDRAIFYYWLGHLFRAFTASSPLHANALINQGPGRGDGYELVCVALMRWIWAMPNRPQLVDPSVEAALGAAPPRCHMGTAFPHGRRIRPYLCPHLVDLATSDLATSDLATSDLATSDLATSDLATSGPPCPHFRPAPP
jgi:hypothetical protein